MVSHARVLYVLTGEPGLDELDDSLPVFLVRPCVDDAVLRPDCGRLFPRARARRSGGPGTYQR